MSSPNPPVFNTELSRIEQRFDPIARAQQGDFESLLGETRATIKNDPRTANLKPEQQEETAQRLARIRIKRQMEQGAAARNASDPEPPHPLMGVSPGGHPTGSLLDTYGLGALRKPETYDTIANALPVVGGLVGEQLLRRVVPPPAKAFVDRLSMLQMATQTERGLSVLGGVSGAGVGALMEKQLEDASAMMRLGKDPAFFKETPVVGFFLSGPVDEKGRPVPFRDRFARLMNAASEEMLLESTGTAVGEAVAKGGYAAIKALIGDERFARQTLDDAQKVGVPVGLVDVIKEESAPVAGSMRKLFGAFGPLGKPFREALAQRQADAGAAARREVGGLSSEIGILAERAAQGQDVSRLSRVLNEWGFRKVPRVWKQYAETRDALWDSFLKPAGEIGVIPANTRAHAAGLLAQFSVRNKGAARIIQQSQLDRFNGDIEQFSPRNMTPGQLDLLAEDIYALPNISTGLGSLRGILDQIRRLEPEPTVKALDRLSKNINVAIEEAESKYVASQLMDLRRSIDSDIRRQLSDGHPELLDAFEAARGFSEEWLTLLNGSGARRLKSVAKDFGSQTPQMVSTPGGRMVKNPGNRALTEFLTTLADSPDQSSIRQLYGMLSSIGGDGKRVFDQATALRLDKAFTPTSYTAPIDFSKALRQLGLLNTKDARAQATMEAIRLSGGDVNRVRRLARVADQVLPKNLNLNAATLVVRRAVLGGLATGIASVGGFAGASTGYEKGGTLGAIATATAALVLGRYAGRVLTDPALTKATLDLLDREATGAAQRRAMQLLGGAGLLSVGAAVEEGTSNVVSGMNDIQNGLSDVLSSGSRAVAPQQSIETPLPPIPR